MNGEPNMKHSKNLKKQPLNMLNENYLFCNFPEYICKERKLGKDIRKEFDFALNIRECSSRRHALISFIHDLLMTCFSLCPDLSV